MLKPSTTTISLRLALALRRTIAHQIMHEFTEEEKPLPLRSQSRSPPVFHAVSVFDDSVTSRPFFALLAPLRAFITWNGLLNCMLCRADLFMFFFPS